MTDESAEYGALFSLTCILEEGNITVATGRIKAGGTDLDPYYAFAAEISDGDYVSLSVNAANTPTATGFLPVVSYVAANTDAIIGRVIDEPRWNNTPAATTTTWSTMLGLGQYRVAEVELFCVTGAHAALVLGSAGITNGAPVKWDLSSNAYVDAGTTFTGAFCFHHWATASNAECLIGFGVYAGSGTNTDLVGSDVIA